jgi:hypothetical protein
MKVEELTKQERISVVPGGLGFDGGHEPSHKSRARVAGYYRMSQWDMAKERWPMIENQSCGDFNRGEEKSLVRHYPYFLE